MRLFISPVLRNKSGLFWLLAMWLCLSFVASNPVNGQAETPSATNAALQIHIVAPGDMLEKIASDYGTSVDAIVAANHLVDPDQLTVGQSLLIPVTDEAVSSVAITFTATVVATRPPAPDGRTERGAVGPSVMPSRETPFAPSSFLAAEQTFYACTPDVVGSALALPAEAIRVVVTHAMAYLVANGDLYQLPLQSLAHNPDDSALLPSNLMPSERKVGGYMIQELVDVSLDAVSGDLLVLDKTNDVYRYSVTEGWAMEFSSAQIPGQFPDPQFLAIESVAGAIYALDADLSQIWLLEPGATLPQSYFSNPQLLSGTDMALMGGSIAPVFGVLTYGSDLLRVEEGLSPMLYDVHVGPDQNAWPSQVFAQDDHLFVVDGEERSVTAIDADGVVTRMIFRIPDMPRLRSVALISDTLYALAGPTLYATDLVQAMSGVCPSVEYDDALYFEGLDVRKITAGFGLPFPNAILPIRPRSYPGARRLYRYGIHRGVDLYGLDVRGLGIGSPVQSIGDGDVIRADTDFVEMTGAEYETVMQRTIDEHRTPPNIEDLFLGRQVRIAHEYNVESRYAHLGAIASDIVEGTIVSRGATVGRVGVSGTSAGVQGTNDDAHLHFEIWVNGRYLGHGLSLYETMRLWQAAFDGTYVPSVEATPSPVPIVLVPTPTLLPTPLPTPLPTLLPTPTTSPLPTALPTATATPAADTACQKPPDDYTRVYVRGHEVNARTYWMLELTETLYEGKGDPFRVVQGSYTEDVAESFGTHAGGGVVDISIRLKADPSQLLTLEEAGELVMALRQAGFAAWLRLPDDLVPQASLHIHAVAVGDRELSEAARRQLDGPEGYFRGLDGVRPENGGPKADRYGGAVLCDWMVELGFGNPR